jgi:hypothetical protein
VTSFFLFFFFLNCLPIFSFPNSCGSPVSSIGM